MFYYSLFIKSIYHLIEYLEVQRMPDSTIANRSWAVKFTFTDNKGKSHEIKLKHVIHLPEVSKNIIHIV